MPKMRAPTGFPPRRPSGIVRYILVAIILIFGFYAFGQNSHSSRRQIPFPPKGVIDTEEPTSGTKFPENSYPEEDTLAQLPDTPPVDRPQPKPDTSTPDYADANDGSENVAPNKPKPADQGSSTSKTDSSESNEGHPIDKLIYDAQLKFAELTSKESRTASQAAQAYRKRRGRHPPPNFDKWFEFAQSTKSVVVEDFFDQIYHDIEPLWGLEPSLLRKESASFEMTINIRGGKADAGSDWFWTQIWLNLIKTIEHLLPDMDLALNAMDEPRLVVPFEDMQEHMAKASKTMGLSNWKQIVNEYQNLVAPGDVEPDVHPREKFWEQTRPYWEVARRGCSPESLARTEPLQKSFQDPPAISNEYAEPHLYHGFVSNYTLSTEVCHQPDLQGLEGIFIDPLTVSASKTLFPMFGGSKLPVNNEILLPAPMYWNEEERFTGGDDHGISWSEKQDRAIWRGVATGGKNREDNWRGFQRHRFAAMNNGTKVSRVVAGEERAENFALPDSNYSLPAGNDGKLGEWVSEWADVGLTDLFCDPPEDCRHTEPHFERIAGLKMSEQFSSKFLPDIDGNSFSGRYLGFLRSTSLPIKATIWREWHDSRLVAWKHFIPMDSRYGDWYGIMDYFLGYKGQAGHDEAAEKIATEGKEWAEQVLRKEDMQVYVLRLLLEYGRLINDKRDHLGWVQDVINDPSLSKIWESWW